MTKNHEHNDNSAAESAEPSRDARGRWQKGHCPNPKGRPRKRKAKNYDPSDILHFSNTQIELMMNGQPEIMLRREALLNKMFESAMKGKVSQQRHLMGLIQKKDQELSELRQQYYMFMHDWIIDNPHFVSLDESLTREQIHLLTTMSTTLNHYHPGQFTAFLGRSAEHENSQE